MEILSEQVLTGKYIAQIVYLIVVVLFLCYPLYVNIVKLMTSKESKIKHFVFMSGTLILIVLVLLGLCSKVQQGKEVEYKAIITDFNVVYEKGYEIIDSEGKIYTLKKKE